MTTVDLLEVDGNAFAIIGAVQGALVRDGRESDARKFVEEATSGDYDHLIQTALEYVELPD